MKNPLSVAVLATALNAQILEVDINDVKIAEFCDKGQISIQGPDGNFRCEDIGSSKKNCKEKTCTNWRQYFNKESCRCQNKLFCDYKCPQGKKLHPMYDC